MQINRTPCQSTCAICVDGNYLASRHRIYNHTDSEISRRVIANITDNLFDSDHRTGESKPSVIILIDGRILPPRSKSSSKLARVLVAIRAIQTVKLSDTSYPLHIPKGLETQFYAAGSFTWSDAGLFSTLPSSMPPVANGGASKRGVMPLESPFFRRSL